MAYPLEDHLQILNVIGRYSFALDDRKQAELIDCFHPDAQIAFCGTILAPAEFAQATTDLLRGIVGVHQSGNHVVQIDGAQATATSYVYAVHKLPANNDQAEVIFGRVEQATDSLILGRYDDRFERREGVWKLVFRKITFIWQQHLPTMAPVPGWSAMQPAPTQ